MVAVLIGGRMEAMPGGGYAEWRLCRVEAMPDGAMPSGGYAEWRLCRGLCRGPAGQRWARGWVSRGLDFLQVGLRPGWACSKGGRRARAR